MRFEKLGIIIFVTIMFCLPQLIIAQDKDGMQMEGGHGQMMSHPEAMDDNMKVHHDHIKTMERVFRYERNFAEKADEIRVGYLYKVGDADSEKDKDAMVMMAKTMVEQGLAGKSISFDPVGVETDADFNSQLAEKKVNVIYIGSGLTADELVVAQKYSIKENILTIGSTSDVAEQGIAAVGIVVNHGKMDLIINMVTAQETGADFDPRLYRLADKVIK